MMRFWILDIWLLPDGLVLSLIITECASDESLENNDRFRRRASSLLLSCGPAEATKRVNIPLLSFHGKGSHLGGSTGSRFINEAFEGQIKGQPRL